jgi:transposase
LDLATGGARSVYLTKVRSPKSGKTYWRLVRSVRGGCGPRQRTVAYLGTLEEEERRGWGRLARLLDRRGPETPDLFVSEAQAQRPVSVVPGQVEVERVRRFGDAWVGWELWRLLGLEEFFAGREEKGREAVSWGTMIAYSSIARFCAPSSELAVADHFADSSALADLLGIDADRINDDRLYRTLDRLLGLKAALLDHLRRRYEDLFSSDHDLLLYDLTSTYFEGEAEGNRLARRGYSRDGRSDAKQVVIALVVTREGLPLACEVFAGNRHDSTTLRAIVRLVQWRYGRARRVWVMDRGTASEDNLGWLRGRGGLYLVGTPKSGLRAFERHLLTASWKTVREGVEAAIVTSPDGREETYVLCRSRERREKELAILERFSARLEQGLRALQSACESGRLGDPLALGKRLGVLLKENSRAARLYEVRCETRPDGSLGLSWKRREREGDSWAERSAGHYLLRTNLSGTLAPDELWRAYIQLTEVEAGFRALKSDLSLRPVFHQRLGRVKAHVFLCFLALVLRKTFELRLDGDRLGRSPSKVLAELREWCSMDVILPTTDGRRLRRRVLANPSPSLAILLRQLHLPGLTGRSYKPDVVQKLPLKKTQPKQNQSQLP